MPQMSPINWLSLFILFSLTFMLFNMMNYFLIIPSSSQSKTSSKSTKSLVWKW
uniref:ATP synthase F0 subunit 8 n=1 Tax=Chyliza bambusae TaxID=2963719 RepID=UPI0021159EFE|nr:ATP synthase F0 subunit 8 [Chyliza bambusae]UTM10314.1 ATP synthase F0 subunit 8 [Chyliza bambusae]